MNRVDHLFIARCIVRLHAVRLHVVRLRAVCLRAARLRGVSCTASGEPSVESSFWVDARNNVDISPSFSMICSWFLVSAASMAKTGASGVGRSCFFNFESMDRG